MTWPSDPPPCRADCGSEPVCEYAYGCVRPPTSWTSRDWEWLDDDGTRLVVREGHWYAETWRWVRVPRWRAWWRRLVDWLREPV